MNEPRPFLRLQDIHVGRRGAARPQLDRFSLTLAAGEMALVFSNGTYWYELHNEPAA